MNLLLIALALYAFWLCIEHNLRCRYCGRFANHEDHCPWDAMNKEER